MIVIRIEIVVLHNYYYDIDCGYVWKKIVKRNVIIVFYMAGV